jgi:hypothetical protein
VNFLTQILPYKIKTRGLPNEKILSSAMSHSAGQKFAIRFLGEFETEYVRKYFRVLIRGLGVIDWRKIPRVKNLVTLSWNFMLGLGCLQHALYE